MELEISQLAYSRGYPGQVRLKDCTCNSMIRLSEPVNMYFYTISIDGLITAHQGYAWNLANKPAINTKSFIRASLFHDIICQAIAAGVLDPKWREEADRLMLRITTRDKMCKLRRWWTFKAVKYYGRLTTKHTAGRGGKKIMYIPEGDNES